MATFDQLSAEQRAIIELVLKQNQSYEQLGTMLAMPTSRVRELARESLVRLSPVSAAAVDDDWRGQLADYLLNQQNGPEGTATKGHLRRSESARGWARSVLDSLDQFYDPARLPTIPEGEPAAAPRRQRRSKERKPRAAEAAPAGAAAATEDQDEREAAPRPRRNLSPGARDAVRRRRIIGLGSAAAILLLLIVLVWPVGLLTGGGDDSKPKKASTTTGQPRILGQLVLRPLGGAAKNSAGVAVIAQRGAQRQLIVQAQLTPTKNGQAYEVWLYNSRKDARSMGAQVTDSKGTFQGAGQLPSDFSKYRYIDVSLERVDQNKAHSGNSVLRGRLDQLQAPQQQPQGQSTTPQSTTPQSTAPQGSTTTPGQ